MNKIKGYFNKKICKECKGDCCKKSPGILFPEELKNITKESIHFLIKTNKWCFDCWDGDVRDNKYEYNECYFIRPTIKGKEGIILDKSWGGECNFLTEKGCSLLIKDRPLGCRMLIPNKENNCDYSSKNKQYEKKEAAISWLPYRNIFIEIIKEKRR